MISLKLWISLLILYYFLRELEGSVKFSGMSQLYQDSSGFTVILKNSIAIKRISLKTDPPRNCTNFNSMDIRVGGQYPDKDISDWQERNNKCLHTCEDPSWINGFTADFTCFGNPKIGRILTLTSVPNETNIHDIMIFAAETNLSIRSKVDHPLMIGIKPGNTKQISIASMEKDASKAVNPNRAEFTLIVGVKPWWAADLTAVYTVTSVTMYTQLTPHQHVCARFYDIEVKVGNTAPIEGSSDWISSNKRCNFAYITAHKCEDGVGHEYVCNQPPPRGQFVSIQSLKHAPLSSAIDLSYVKVYGVKASPSVISTAGAPKILLESDKTSQINTHSTYVAANALNADLLDLFTHTAHVELSWWAVDLGGDYMVTLVDVIPRERPLGYQRECSRFQSIEVRVGDSNPDTTNPKWPRKNAFCANFRGPQNKCDGIDAKVSFTCSQFPPPTGRYVSIQKTRFYDENALELGYVEVYGHPIDKPWSSTMIEDNKLEIQALNPTPDEFCESVFVDEDSVNILTISPLYLRSIWSCAWRCQRYQSCHFFTWDIAINSSCYHLSEVDIIMPSYTIGNENSYYSCHGVKARLYIID